MTRPRRPDPAVQPTRTSMVVFPDELRRRVAALAEPPPVVSVSRSYEVIGRLDQGGMAEIFLARVSGSAGFSKEVVIKRLRRNLAAEPAFAAAFVEEAQLLARFSHPNVCQVHDLVIQGGQFYLAMEYLDGLPLAAVLGRGAIEARMLCGIAAQLCEGLHHVHSLRRPDGTPTGVVHRDISPQNLFLTTAGAAVILDFGIAKTRDSARSTPFGRVKGKVGYMSPEQLGGRRLDARSDLYSLGLVLSDAAGSAAAFAPVIRRALAEEPGHRFQTAREMREAIDRVAAEVGGAAAPSELADWLATRCGRDLAERREWAARAARQVRAQSTRQAAPSRCRARRPSGWTACKVHPCSSVRRHRIHRRRDAVRRRWRGSRSRPRSGSRGGGAAATATALHPEAIESRVRQRCRCRRRSRRRR